MNCPLQTHGLHELARQALARSSLAGGNQSSAVVTVKVESDQRAERKSKRGEREGSKAYWGNENPLPAAGPPTECAALFWAASVRLRKFLKIVWGTTARAPRYARRNCDSRTAKELGSQFWVAW